jgi:predicted nucleic acid-binding protein
MRFTESVWSNWNIAVVDTNVFVYAHDPRDPVKQAKAQAIIREQAERNGLITSAQVLNEFYSALTRPHRPPSLSHEQASERVSAVADVSIVFPLSRETTLAALDGVGRYGLSFWDALIWATAKLNGVETVYTEDTPGAPVIEGVRYINPFIDED